MQTKFSSVQLAEPTTAAAATAIRSCVHCGFCNATCPTYVLRGDELDGPRGRIYLVKEMLEQSATPSAEVVKHVDRCLSCLACETTCPSGVSYRRLIDKGRAYIDEHYRRPIRDRLLRALLAFVLPYRRRLAVAMALARVARPTATLIARVPALRSVATMLQLSGRVKSAAVGDDFSAYARSTVRPYRVVLMRGCVEPVLDPGIQAAAARLLMRAGCDVVRVENEGCCGALPHHMGQEERAMMMARASVDTWIREVEAGPLDAIVVTASGCGTVIRDYGYMLRDDPLYAKKATRVSALACDITELLDRIGLPPVVRSKGVVVGYHAACSLQHGQKVRAAPARLLSSAGFDVRQPAEAHLCCGSAGVYNILQPEIADQLRIRKAAKLNAVQPDVIATGNIGCIVQIGRSTVVPVVHVAELLDWATGGPAPAGLTRASNISGKIQ